MYLKIYSKINLILELACTISNKLDPIDKNYIIDKIKNLNWGFYENYCKNLSKQNLISYYFLLWKIVIMSNNIILINKFNFDDKIIEKINNDLQNRLWKILSGNKIELL
jgi:hypothetical protein